MKNKEAPEAYETIKRTMFAFIRENDRQDIVPFVKADFKILHTALSQPEQEWQDISHAKKDGTEYLGIDKEGATSVFRWCKHNHVPLYGWVRQIELYGEDVDGFDPVLFMEFKPPKPPLTGE